MAMMNQQSGMSGGFALDGSSTTGFLQRLQRDPAKKSALYNDGLVFLCFVYSAVDILLDWENALSCQKQVGTWLIGSYAMITTFRLVTHIAQAYCRNGDEDRLLHPRQQEPVCRGVALFTWIILVPCFFYWTARGSRELLPLLWAGRVACMPMERPWFVLLCLLLCYCWVLMCLIYLATILRFEYRLWRAEAALRAIESPDSLQRWGRQSVLSAAESSSMGGSSLQSSGLLTKGGLTPGKIALLPRGKLPSTSPLIGDQCAICLTDFLAGDSARRLPGCRHAFHQECIDLWLLRSSACPLCKCDVVVPPHAAASAAGHHHHHHPEESEDLVIIDDSEEDAAEEALRRRTAREIIV